MENGILQCARFKLSPMRWNITSRYHDLCHVDGCVRVREEMIKVHGDISHDLNMPHVPWHVAVVHDVNGTTHIPSN